MSRRHELKCWPESFDAIRSGAKRFDVRIDDRAFQVGDELHLRAWDPMPSPVARASAVGYLGKALTARVTYIARGAWGLPSSVVVMSLVVEDDAAEDVTGAVLDAHLARWG